MKEYQAFEGWPTYVPDFDGNRDEENPVTVEIKPLMVRETRRIAGGVTAKRAKGGGFKTNQGELSLKTFVNHVRNIKNLMYDGRPITTAEELLDTPLNELANEIEEAIGDISILDEGDVKNFEQQSDGISERKHGTAINAANSNKGHETVKESTGE